MHVAIFTVAKFYVMSAVPTDFNLVDNLRFGLHSGPPWLALRVKFFNFRGVHTAGKRMFRVYNIMRWQIKKQCLRGYTYLFEILVKCHYERPILYWQ